eukprot:gnl/TRDRNA2_/TRDRNA2_188714_c0_seq1.p1 gnl/TRDRNA2_/TRDRNA2_188714_c0~~gnl/TRDRNA2_/TRDRNA2_188714_c0_seq1.p1  ORF type:complete len:243 (-),score=67.25 gnl/TRDRNA2_/TRDRNA2_188714_c0_seq1:41-769(-)
MGVSGSVAESPVMSYLQDEFNRVRQLKQDKDDTTPKQREHASQSQGQVLHLDEIQQLNPPQDVRLDLRHIATLWKLDSDRDGAVSFSELANFAEFYNTQRKIFGSLDFQSKLKAQCVVELFEVICEDRGAEAFVDWMCLLVCQGEDFAAFDASPGVKFMSRDAVYNMYRLLQPYQIDAHVDQQGFLDMLQQVGEHMNLMALQAEELDDWVPVEVVQRFAKRFVEAWRGLFQELDLQPPTCRD